MSVSGEDLLKGCGQLELDQSFTVLFHELCSEVREALRVPGEVRGKFARLIDDRGD